MIARRRRLRGGKKDEGSVHLFAGRVAGVDAQTWCMCQKPLEIGAFYTRSGVNGGRRSGAFGLGRLAGWTSGARQEAWPRSAQHAARCCRRPEPEEGHLGPDRWALAERVWSQCIQSIVRLERRLDGEKREQGGDDVDVRDRQLHSRSRATVGAQEDERDADLGVFDRCSVSPRRMALGRPGALAVIRRDKNDRSGQLDVEKPEVGVEPAIETPGALGIQLLEEPGHS
jgi:hypothetical protein